MSELPSETGEHALILLLLTDDANQEQTLEPAWKSAWCGLAIEDTVAKLLKRRPDLKDRFVIQHARLGLTTELIGGLAPPPGRRVLLVMLDREHRLLGFTLGVPELETLHALVEDAEEVSQQISLSTRQGSENVLPMDPATALTELLMDRANSRLNRSWQTALASAKQTLKNPFGAEPEPIEDEDNAKPGEQSFKRKHLSDVVSFFRPVYQIDLTLRFGPSVTAEPVRQIQVEQHTETAQLFCDSLLPFLAGADMNALFVDFASVMWSQPVVTKESDTEDWGTWWMEQPEGEMVVITIVPDLGMQKKALLADSATATLKGRGIGWTELQKLLEQDGSFQSISISGLATLLRDQNLAPIQLTVPSFARYLVFKDKTAEPVVIREGDLPAKHFTRIKRWQRTEPPLQREIP
ncbi:hypothetical protein Pla52nx_000904 [Stieleria varia]|uniref:Uncharacterized protein n=2 Tax=Stieleria varia TaxID=2528005 RepID=A0A5C6AZT7_9BACT|nr:hypothetical protein Pla52n_26840 [Stieleria varia]